jgi:segregation and condensation protein B
MPLSPDPQYEPQPQGISLDELAEAFAQVMGAEPRRAEETPAGAAEPSPDVPEDGAVEAKPQAADQAPDTAQPTALPEEDSCPVNPRTILEAMLFVGNRENQPLRPARAAELMRDVAADEIPTLVDELNRRYDADGAPYRVIGEGDGYRLSLRDEHHPLRNRFYGRIREARLSQAAIDVLALVAYQQPITGEKIGRLRGRPSSHVLAHLVRRGLLRIERSESGRRTPHYHTTDRFLRLFHLDSLADLPRSEDSGPP